jgi:copper(I)-binding protein
MSTPTFSSAYDAAVQANAAMAVRALARQEAQDPEVAGVIVEVFADGSIEVQLLNGQSVPVGGYSL